MSRARGALARVGRAIGILVRLRSIPAAMAAVRHRQTGPLLASLRSGALARYTRGEYDIHYRAARFKLPPSALEGLPALLQAVDDGWEVTDRKTGTWVVSRAGAGRFAVPAASMISDLSILQERFTREEYAFFDVQGMRVLDIGANLGDSAIYFARRGSKAVYAFEPFPRTAAQARENIRLNGLEGSVHLFELGIGANEERRAARYLPLVSGGLTSAVDPQFQSAAHGEETELHLITLEQAVALVQPEPGETLACKMDCEGAEFEIFASDAILAPLRFVRNILVEYHYDSPRSILDVLRAAGFTVRTWTTQPGVGLIHGFRDLQGK